jgi:hypothetical protein
MLPFDAGLSYVRMYKCLEQQDLWRNDLMHFSDYRTLLNAYRSRLDDCIDLKLAQG